MAGEKKTTEEKTEYYKVKSGSEEKEKNGSHAAELARSISGPTKAAIVMVALGSEASSKILKNLDEHEVERLDRIRNPSKYRGK